MYPATHDGGMPARSDHDGRRCVPLPGGGVLTLRPVTPADVDGLEALYAGLSDDDRSRRFFSQYRPPRSFFERLAGVADRGGFGLVATDGARIVGEANYELLPDGDGELGMTVAADRRGWLGPYLLDALVEAAAARGIPNLEAEVLVTNRRMLDLLRSRGYATMSSDGWTSLRLIVGTAGRTPVWPAAGAGAGRPRVLVEALGGRWHADAAARDAGLDVVACSGPRGRRPRCPVLAGRACPLAAGADAIVVSNVPDDAVWRAIVGAHADLHPGVPVCVESCAGRRPPAPGGTITLDDDETRVAVAVVDRLARAHRTAAGRAP